VLVALLIVAVTVYLLRLRAGGATVARETALLIGPADGGKTTLLALLCTGEPPRRGTVTSMVSRASCLPGPVWPSPHTHTHTRHTHARTQCHTHCDTHTLSLSTSPLSLVINPFCVCAPLRVASYFGESLSHSSWPTAACHSAAALDQECEGFFHLFFLT
jgi:hypothetical protein